jgi:hypothetical protein
VVGRPLEPRLRGGSQCGATFLGVDPVSQPDEPFVSEHERHCAEDERGDDIESQGTRGTYFTFKA